MGWLKGLLSGGLGTIVSPVAKVFEKREDRKKAVDVIKAKTVQGAAEGETQISLTNAQWELISKRNENDTWKDEYITILITSPLVCMLAGNVLAVFFDDVRLLQANAASLAQLAAVGIDMGELMLYTVLAALGIKLIK